MSPPCHRQRRPAHLRCFLGSLALAEVAVSLRSERALLMPSCVGVSFASVASIIKGHAARAHSLCDHRRRGARCADSSGSRRLFQILRWISF